MARTTVVSIVVKDPADTRTFKMDWSAHLETQQIANSAWVVPTGLTLVANGIIEGNVKTYLTVSGGTVGNSYVVTNTITIANSVDVYSMSGQIDVRDY